MLGLHTWSSRASVQAYFLSSRTLVREHGPDLVLPHTVMVEGNFVAPPPDGRMLEPVVIIGEDEDEPRPYGLLQGKIGATTIVGVPDVVAYNPALRRWRVADYKTTRTVLTPDVLREDAQLNVYLVLLHQVGLIPAGAEVEIGQIYLSDTVQAVWVDMSDRFGTIPPRLVQQVEQTRSMIDYL